MLGCAPVRRFRRLFIANRGEVAARIARTCDAMGITPVFGVSEGGPMSAMFAAAHPDRTVALAMYGSYPKRIASVDYPWAPTPEGMQRSR